MTYVNLHAHSHYSLLDGFGSPKNMVLRAKELGHKAAGLTDHGVTYGLIEFYQAAKAEGIKPILGCETYVAPRTRFDKETKIDTNPYHLTLLAKSNEGYKNLIKLVSKASLEGFYYKPRVDYGLLKVYSKDLIALSGCLIGHLPRVILSKNEDEIKRIVETHIDIFGKENYFLEIQDHPLMEEQNMVNEKMKELSKKYKLGLIATNDSHYPRPEDSEVHDVLLCIQTQSTINDEDRMRYVGDFSIRENKDMETAFKDFPDAISNTLKVANMCNVDFEFGKNLIPHFKTPQNEKPDVYLKEMCEEGLKVRFEGKKIPKEYTDRLKYELGVVHKTGFDTYFLIVHDFVKYAKDKNIIVGPGRGSAAGSILAWSLNITDLDPIKYGLFFERFLNPERISMPDIDIDFADSRRDEVLDYVVEKYGRDNVAQIITFGTMAPKASIRDAGRALGYPYAEVDKLAKTVPPPVLGKHQPLNVSVKDDPDLSYVYENDARAKVLLDYARKLEGTVRHAGTHACAVVISEKPLTEYTALQHGAGGGDEIVTQYSANPIEALGLLKMDFLGLRNLTVIEKTCKIIERTRNETVDIDKISLEDKAVFSLLQKGDTTGVFQLESPGMRRYLKQLKPTNFEDITAMGALYRPGPMEWIPTYIKGKHNPKSVKYLHDSFKPILESTYGVAVYQEQILQLARDFAGYTLGEADILRKAVGKKIATLLAKQREKFVKGAVKQGHKEKFALEVFEKVIEPFAGYGFNRAHAACYAMIAYQTAYLKALYPIEFMTALLCSDAENMDRVVLEIKECNEMGIDVLPPSINESFSRFTVVDEKTIRFGLLAIKGVGEGPIKEIIEVRNKGGHFKSLEDFAKRVPAHLLNKKLIQAVAYCGAFDDFGDRKQIAESYEDISKFAKLAQEVAVADQTSIFGIIKEDEQLGELKISGSEESSRMERLKWEKEFLGMYVSGHPLRGLKRYIRKKAHLISDLDKKNVGKVIKVVGLVSGIKKMLTKAGTYMMIFSVEDPTARIQAVMFPRTYAKYGDILSEDMVISLGGKFDNRRGQYQVICDAAKALSIDTMIANARESRDFDENDKSDIAMRLIDDILNDSEDEKDVEAKSEEADIEDFDISDVAEKVEGGNFMIEIPSNVNGEVMKSLKELLEKHKGDTPVELLFKSDRKRLKLPFGVKVSEELKGNISSLLNA